MNTVSALPRPQTCTDTDALALLDGRKDDLVVALLAASQDCVKLVDPDGTLVFMNTNGQNAMEIDDFAAVRHKAWADLWPEEARAQLQEALARARAGQRSSFEALCPTAKGTQKWWSVSVVPMHADAAGVDRILIASRDITAQVLREQDARAYAQTLEQELAEKSDLLAQRDFLMREIDHRVKNSLAQIASILRLQARRSSADVRAALDDAARRIASVARVHEQLQTSGDFRQLPVVALIQRLCAELSLSLDRVITVQATVGDGLVMPSERASALCIILSELVANAARHGARQGDIAVDLCPQGEQVLLQVRNPLSPGTAADAPTGGTAAGDAAADKGLGSMICETYAASLSGGLTWTRTGDTMLASLIFVPQA